MTDHLDPDARSRLMASVRRRDTAPEMKVRRLAHAMGYRFRVDRKDLPGRPDVVFPRFTAAVFVHGCFWHRHPGCRRASEPKTNEEAWRRKFQRNVARDAAAEEALRAAGWRVLVLWECEVGNEDALRSKLSCFLVDDPPARNV